MMRFGAHSKSRWWMVLGISITTAVVCLWPKTQPVKLSGSKPDLQLTRKAANTVAGPIRVRKSGDAFYAEQKEKRIKRMLAGVADSLSQRDPLLRSEYFTQLVASLADEDVPLVLGRLDAGLQHSEFGVLLFRRWMTIEPATAAKWAETLPAGEVRNEMLSQAAVIWAEQDAKAAIAWVGGLTESEAKQHALAAIAGELVSSQPQSALELTAQLPNSETKQQVMSRALAEWATQEPVNALRWVARLEDHALQVELRRSLITSIAAIDGESGARLTVAWLKPGAEQEWVAVSVAQQWAQVSPAAAADWVNRFPPGAMREAAVENLNKIWLAQKQDREHAAKVEVIP